MTKSSVQFAVAVSRIARNQMINRRFVAASIGATIVAPVAASAANGSGQPGTPVSSTPNKQTPWPTPPQQAAAAPLPPPPDRTGALAPLERDAAAWTQTLSAFQSSYGPMFPLREVKLPAVAPSSGNDPKLLTYAAPVDKTQQNLFRYSHVEIRLRSSLDLVRSNRALPKPCRSRRSPETRSGQRE
jgi:hypothetical protein